MFISRHFCAFNLIFSLSFRKQINRWTIHSTRMGKAIKSHLLWKDEKFRLKVLHLTSKELFRFIISYIVSYSNSKEKIDIFETRVQLLWSFISIKCAKIEVDTSLVKFLGSLFIYILLWIQVSDAIATAEDFCLFRFSFSISISSHH